MKRIKKWILSIFLASTTISSMSIYAEDRKPEKPTDATETCAFSHFTTAEQMAAILKKYPPVYKASIEYFQTENEYGSVKIPGIEATVSLEDDKRSICSMMSQQGLCVTEDYILMSAYCHSHNHNSVLYVIDKETRSFIKEIILPGKPHVGGIAYDTNRQEIWVCSKKSGVPELCVFSLEQLELYSSDTNEPIQYMYRYSVPIIENASYMTYHDDIIYVGTFSQENDGCKLLSFSLSKTENEPVSDSGRYFTYLGIKDTYKEIQGIAIHDNNMYFSRSYGTAISRFDVFDRSTKAIKLDNSKKLIQFPQKMEQFYFEGDTCYMLFESASNAYNTSGDDIMDRIIVVNIYELIK